MADPDSDPDLPPPPADDAGAYGPRAPWRVRAREALADLATTLQRWPWMDTLKTLGQRFREDHLDLNAGSLTFTSLMALVPLMTVAFAVFTAFPMFSTFEEAVKQYLFQGLVPESIASPLVEALTQFAEQANRIGAIGLAVLVVTAVALMLTIDRTLNDIWRVRRARSLGRRVLVYWAALTLGPLLMGMSLTLTSYAVSASSGWVGDLPGGWSVSLRLVDMVLFALGMAALFRYVPNTHVRWAHALSGGVFVAIGFEAAKSALGWYLSQAQTYTTIYGAFATVPIFLIWLYMTWVIVLLGAIIAAYAPSLQMRVVRQPTTPGHRFLLAVQVLRELAAARMQDVRGLSGGRLSARLRIDPLQIAPVLEVLTRLGWVGRLDEPDDARHVLLCDPATTPAQPLLAQLLLDPNPALRGFWRAGGLGEMTLAQVLNDDAEPRPALAVRGDRRRTAETR